MQRYRGGKSDVRPKKWSPAFRLIRTQSPHSWGENDLGSGQWFMVDWGVYTDGYNVNPGLITFNNPLLIHNMYLNFQSINPSLTFSKTIQNQWTDQQVRKFAFVTSLQPFSWRFGHCGHCKSVSKRAFLSETGPALLGRSLRWMISHLLEFYNLGIDGDRHRNFFFLNQFWDAGLPCRFGFEDWLSIGFLFELDEVKLPKAMRRGSYCDLLVLAISVCHWECLTYKDRQML